MPDLSTSAHTRQAILEAAAHEVLEHGYAGASLSSIAGRLGLTKGALAYHFPTKDRIITALLERFQSVLAESDNAAAEVFGDSPSRACVALVVNVGHAAGTDIVTTAAMSLFSDPSVSRDGLIGAMTDWVDRVLAHLQAMVAEEGYTFGVDLHDAAEFFIATLGGTWMTARYFPRTAARPRLQFTQLALEAIGLPPAVTDAVVADVLAAARDQRVRIAPVELMTGEPLQFRYGPPDAGS
ncbi:TetR/AcrR family transcriptional regulator [Ruania zhangjianzhongii]|uniref:TetR/AcrR family transcriptional regulator n=1 Tax=Ruania zhangjianzhongii TaxID=2603206 RepID=UPI0011C85A6E|nr:TetR/AcrR family transcriptional regulator [Ruania zhangjianzhongii]